MLVRLTVNGEEREADVWPGSSLLFMLREHLGLPGSKNACEQGECGSCSVWMEGELVCSCLVLAAQAEGLEVRTVEALAGDGALHPVQQAFVDAGAVQCGFCTPGLIVAVTDLLEHQHDPDDATIREALSGNLCRCTGYQKIIDAVHLAAARSGGGLAVSTLLIHGAEVVATMDDAGTEVAGGSILIRDGAIEWVGSSVDEPGGADEVVDASGCVAVPGLVNTHHHLYQVLTRVRVQDGGLFRWLTELYPTWAGLDEEWTRTAAGVGLAELALSGCTTSTDHHYVFPSGVGDLLAAEIEAAGEVGVRFHPCRGSMDLGASDGGLPPDSIVQDRDTILQETEDAVARFHDPSPSSTLRIAVAPCSPFSVTTELMKESAALARRLGLRLHTHIAEALDEDDFCLERFGVRPIQLLGDLEFLGPDVWLAHGVHLSDTDIAKLAATGTGIAHCPSSNLRLASGIARVRDLLDAGAPVGLGVDGSASNDSNDLLAEVRQAMFVARAGMDPTALSAREALRLATRGGAACLGRDDDIGSLEPGKRGDVALFDVTGLPFAGAEDFVAALAFCAPRRVRDLFVEGRRVVADGRLTGVDEERLAADGHRVARRIAMNGGAV